MDLLIRFLADGTLLLLLIATAIALIVGVNRSRWATTIPIAIMAGLTSLLVGKLMSLVYQPAIARPFIELGVEPGAAFIDNPGFPSDHALLATVAVMAIFMLTKYRVLAYAMALVVVAMGIARVAAHVHTPLDVIGGVVAGLAGTYWYIRK